MALQIIGAGFGRTGTMSLYTALKQLGFPCYHMVEVLENKVNKSHLDFWLQVARGTPGQSFDWEQVFSNYTATVDNPAVCVWRELLAAYPQAKVILSLHPKGPDTWYDSTLETIYFTENRWQFKVLELFTPFGRKIGEISRTLIWGRSHRGSMVDRARAVARYEEHIEEVRAAVPPERLLIFSVEHGWKPLCDFLGLPIPEGQFPNVNDRQKIKAAIDGIVRGAYAILGLLGAAVAAGVWGLMRWMS